jgi:hypothetical protein
VACLVGPGALLGKREGVLFKDCARAAGARVASVGTGAEPIPEPREDGRKGPRHEQFPCADTVLRCQLVQFVNAPATGEVGERVRVSKRVAGAVECAAIFEVCKVEELHLLVVSAVVVEDVEGRLGVSQEHHGCGADKASECELSGDDRQELQLRDRVAEQVEGDREGKEVTVQPATEARDFGALFSGISVREQGALEVCRDRGCRMEGVFEEAGGTRHSGGGAQRHQPSLERRTERRRDDDRGLRVCGRVGRVAA